MTVGQFWTEHHTLISLVFGLFITIIFFKIPILKVPWKILIILILMFLFTGLVGVLKYLCLLLIVGVILYGGFASIGFLGIVATLWFTISRGWELKWWQMFLIGAIWAPLSMLLDIGIVFVLGFIVKVFGIPPERLPDKISRRLG